MTRPLSDLSWPRSTARLALRPATPEDVAAIYGYRSLPEVGHWLTRLPTDRDSFTRHMIEHLEVVLVVEHEGRLVGDLMLRVHDAWSQAEAAEQAKDAQAEIGWALAPQAQGRGFATEAVSELITITFELGVRRIEASCFADNEGSWRLMERVGMRREGHHLRDTLHRDGTWHDGIVYGLLADEWASR
ncbi:GNAT family N-acetyltransferase [Ornithinimicrobium faecis]|uniref:GNAT family N-acetyltransferase n=1 Tax=Ornithinimicrobium faecis TaxID=2934158 RepID=A0ABY4YVN9_9MICO|nr:GNAT family protein [Ornithinimicrobium sp. HY1793]USQ80800.1 GNAT family N-acetyltransferase [Ornithinimicrobium sp. HY1793]